MKNEGVLHEAHKLAVIVDLDLAKIAQLQAISSSHDYRTGSPDWPFEDEVAIIANGHIRQRSLFELLGDEAEDFAWAGEAFTSGVWLNFSAYSVLHFGSNVPVHQQPYTDSRVIQLVVDVCFRERKQLEGEDETKIHRTDMLVDRLADLEVLGSRLEAVKKLARDAHVRESIYGAQEMPAFAARFTLSTVSKFATRSGTGFLWTGNLESITRHFAALVGGSDALHEISAGVVAAYAAASKDLDEPNPFWIGRCTINSTTGVVDGPPSVVDTVKWKLEVAKRCKTVKAIAMKLKPTQTYSAANVNFLKRCFTRYEQDWINSTGAGDWYPGLCLPETFASTSSLGILNMSIGNFIVGEIMARLYDRSTAPADRIRLKVAKNGQYSFAEALRHRRGDVDLPTLESLEIISSFLFTFIKEILATLIVISQASADHKVSIIHVSRQDEPQYSLGRLHNRYFVFNSLFSLINEPAILPFTHDPQLVAQLRRPTAEEIEEADPTAWVVNTKGELATVPGKEKHDKRGKAASVEPNSDQEEAAGAAPKQAQQQRNNEELAGNASALREEINQLEQRKRTARAEAEAAEAAGSDAAAAIESAKIAAAAEEEERQRILAERAQEEQERQVALAKNEQEEEQRREARKDDWVVEEQVRRERLAELDAEIAAKKEELALLHEEIAASEARVEHLQARLQAQESTVERTASAARPSPLQHLPHLLPTNKALTSSSAICAPSTNSPAKGTNASRFDNALQPLGDRFPGSNGSKG